MKKSFSIIVLCYCMAAYGQTDSIRQVDLSEIIVTATRANDRIPTAFSDIKARDADRQMVMPEIPSAIGLSPSVVSTSENGAALGNQSFRIRGSDATRINVTFDGVPLNDGESQSVFWVNMPDLLSSLQTVQIQRGVGTSVNGSAAFGATINMQTVRPAESPYAIISSALGSFDTYKVNVATGTGRFKNGWNADIRYSNAGTNGYIDHSGSKQQSAFFTGGYSSSQRIIKMNVFWGEQQTDISWEGVPETEIDNNRKYNPSGLYTDQEGNLVRYDDETDNYKQAHIHLHYSERLGKNMKLNTILYYIKGKGYYEQYKEDARLKKYGLPDYNNQGTIISYTDLIRRKWLDNDLWGAILTASYTTDKTNAHLGVSGSYFSNDHFGKIIWAQYQPAVPDQYEWYDNSGSKQDISSYFKITQQISPHWFIFGDLQWRYINYKMEGMDDDLADMVQDHQYHFWNPKAGITCILDPRQRLYASFAISHREPTRSDLKDAFKYGGTESPQPETLYDAEAGYSFSGNIFSAGINLFYMYYNDQLVNTGKLSNTGYALMENVPDSYRTGIELTFGLRPLKKMLIEGNMTLSRNRIKDYVAFVDVVADDGSYLPQKEEHLGNTDLVFSPGLTGAADISYEILTGLSVGLSAKYVGKQYYDNTSNDGRRLDGYFVNNIVAGYQVQIGKITLGLQASVNNLWNTGYISNALVYRGYTGHGDEWISRYFFPQPFRNYMFRLTLGI